VAPRADDAREPPVAWHHENPSRIVIVVLGPVDRADIPAVCDRARALLEETGATELVCDLRIFERPCAVLMDALARLQLVATRLGRSMHLRNASPEMNVLLGLAGLAEMLPWTNVN
jgi:hypothetical protein